MMLKIFLDKSLKTPLIRQLFEQLKGLIISGALAGGERLPSTRELAESLKISRNVVLEAYGQLYAEGFIEGREGSGTYVSAGTSFKDYINQ